MGHFRESTAQACGDHSRLAEQPAVRDVCVAAIIGAVCFRLGMRVGTFAGWYLVISSLAIYYWYQCRIYILYIYTVYIYIYTLYIYIYINLNSNLNLILCQSRTSLFFWLKVSLLVGYTPIFVAVLLGQHLGGTNLTAASHVVFLHPMLAPNAERAVGYEMQERRKMVTTTLW